MRPPLYLAVALLPLCLGGCAALPMAIGAAGGMMEILKDGFDMKLDLQQMALVKVAPPPVVGTVVSVAPPAPRVVPLAEQPIRTMQPVPNP